MSTIDSPTAGVGPHDPRSEPSSSYRGTTKRMAKISISIEEDDLRWLRRRARRVHGGNLSASIAEGTAFLRRHEALGALLSKLGAPALGDGERASLGAELDGHGKPAEKRRRRAA